MAAKKSAWTASRSVWTAKKSYNRLPGLSGTRAPQVTAGPKTVYLFGHGLVLLYLSIDLLSVAVLIRELRRSGRPRGPGQQAFPAWRLANRVGSGKSTVGRPKTSPSWLKLAPSRPKWVLLGASGAASGILGRSWPLWGCSWGGPGRLLVRSWRLLGRSWTDLGPLQTSLGSLLGPPGPLVGPLGPLLAAKSSFSRKPRSDLCFAGPIWPPGLPSWPEVGRSWPKLA